MLQCFAGTWTSVKITKVDPTRCTLAAEYQLPTELVVHKRSVHLGVRAITAARKHARLWGAGMAAPTIPTKQERYLISPGSAEHLQGWIFCHNFLEVLKMTGRNIEGGHCYGVKEAVASTFPRYRKDAKKQTPPVVPVSRHVYTRVLADKVFVAQKKVRTCLTLTLTQPEP